MKRQRTHADWTFLPRRGVRKGTQIQFIAEIELSSSLSKLLLDAPALLPMHLPVTLLTSGVAIPDALAVPALHEFIAFLSTSRTFLGWGPVCVVFVFRFGFTLSFRRFDERHGAKQRIKHRCAVLFS